MTWEDKLPAPLRALGKPVVEIRGAETAWPVARAPELVEWLHQHRHAILGGDFYARKGDRFEPTYDNWHCELKHEEEWSDYVDRSCRQALNGLKKGTPDMWIVIVASPKVTAEQKARLAGEV